MPYCIQPTTGDPCATCATLPDEPLSCDPCNWRPYQWTCDGCDGGPEMIDVPLSACLLTAKKLAAGPNYFAETA